MVFDYDISLSAIRIGIMMFQNPLDINTIIKEYYKQKLNRKLNFCIGPLIPQTNKFKTIVETKVKQIDLNKHHSSLQSINFCAKNQKIQGMIKITALEFCSSVMKTNVKIR